MSFRALNLPLRVHDPVCANPDARRRPLIRREYDTARAITRGHHHACMMPPRPTHASHPTRVDLLARCRRACRSSSVLATLTLCRATCTTHLHNTAAHVAAAEPVTTRLHNAAARVAAAEPVRACMTHPHNVAHGHPTPAQPASACPTTPAHPHLHNPPAPAHPLMHDPHAPAHPMRAQPTCMTPPRLPTPRVHNAPPPAHACTTRWPTLRRPPHLRKLSYM
ncbi:hypothetical protein EI94DRAFT_1797847 [Lactarius quietus]|nr:hypothetical protein EI94DRAFT_1797847 [Lactarius quietus]